MQVSALFRDDLQHLGADLLGHPGGPSGEQGYRCHTTRADRVGTGRAAPATLEGASNTRGADMSKRARKRRDRKKNGANHGKKPNA
ncbi:hypothetical protein FNH06_28720 [Amycolatopsis acidiphila]|uniref:Uncharacterized protein n=8 Tax=Pseudonocardiaceae TaxID=2070 RepID=A0A558A1P3_9PSEU|nr:hypothetical protein FNH06_28720 [Amycolatopsis acidiphila]